MPGFWAVQRGRRKEYNCTARSGSVLFYSSTVSPDHSLFLPRSPCFFHGRNKELVSTMEETVPLFLPIVPCFYPLWLVSITTKFYYINSVQQRCLFLPRSPCFYQEVLVSTTEETRSLFLPWKKQYSCFYPLCLVSTQIQSRMVKQYTSGPCSWKQYKSHSPNS